MNREAAIEAGARALWAASLGRSGLDPAMLDRSWPTLASVSRDSLRQGAAAVIDAALPHLVGEPIGYALVWGGWVSPVRQHRVEDVAAYRERTGMDGAIVALVLVEDTP